MNNKDIGKQIKAGRNAKGETQVTMGAKIGASQQLVSAWESGKRPVPKQYRKRLTKDYGVVFEDSKADRPIVEPKTYDLSPVEVALIQEVRGVIDAFVGVLKFGIGRRVRRGGYRRQRA